MPDKFYDVIIIGAGPAGITAGVYAARKRMDCLIITIDIGGQTTWSGDVENYTGYQFVTGPELAAKFEEHLKNYKLELKENEPVIEMYKHGDIVVVKTAKGEYKAKTAIISSGKKSKELGVAGEEKFKNRGLTYCATCDGPLFAGKDVAIIGGGNSSLDAALQLVKIAKKIYIINVTGELGGDAIMRDKVISDEKVEVFNNSQVTEVFGSKFVEGIKIKTASEEKQVKASGIFVEIGLEPNSSFAKELDKNEKQEIIINCQTETNIEGVFAAGDVTNVIEKQIVIAAGEGAKAALRAFGYLARKK
ncbi:MAG: FAD-dependent oxidoreductase [Candidatus Omnitrophota bacterium]